jgi:serine protease Do
MNLATKVVEQLKASGKVSRGYLGMMPRELTPELREASGVSKDLKGVFVERVDKDTPAEKGGLEAGDIITEVDNKPVSDVTQFRMGVADHAPKSNISMRVLRDGKEKLLNFTLADRADYASRLGIKSPGEPEKEEEAWLGIRVEELTQSKADALKLEDSKGVLVTEVDPDGPTHNKLQVRDVIIKIDRMEINNLSDYRDAVKKLKGRTDAILFRLIRNGVRTFEAVEPE